MRLIRENMRIYEQIFIGGKAMKPRLVVISGFSGSGKGTMINRFLEEEKNVFLSESETTRQVRDSNDRYIFVNKEMFTERVKNNYYIEYNLYGGNGNYYGTPAHIVFEKLSEGTDVILEIDTSGYMQVLNHKVINDVNVISVFVVVDADTLYSRLISRDGASCGVCEINKRMRVALTELEYIPRYDYLINNSGSIESAIYKLKDIFDGKGSTDTFSIEKFKARTMELFDGQL